MVARLVAGSVSAARRDGYPEYRTALERVLSEFVIDLS